MASKVTAAANEKSLNQAANHENIAKLKLKPLHKFVSISFLKCYIRNVNIAL